MVINLNKKILVILLFIFILGISFLTYTNNQNNSSEWSIDKKEYPNEEYRLDELPVSHKSAYEVRQFFEDSDVNHDGVLKDQEINTFDYKIKHSQYTFNGPYGYN